MLKNSQNSQGSSISKQLEEGKSIEDIHIDFKLSILKPLHAK